VLANKETIYYFKAFQPVYRQEALYKLKAYLCIDQLRAEDSVHVPNTLGLVQGEDGSSYIGLLLLYIDCDRRTLEGAVYADTLQHLRQR
jgi:hypothetical protein